MHLLFQRGMLGVMSDPSQTPLCTGLVADAICREHNPRHSHPGTGAPSERCSGAGVGATLNCTFPTGTGGEELVHTLREQLVPAMERFRPELVLISAGFDARKAEPISHLQLADEDFATLTRLVMDIADQHAGGRLVSVLEGGYGLAKAAGAHVQALAGATP